MFKILAVGIVCLAGQVEATKLHVSNQAKLEMEAEAAIKALNKVENRIKLMEKNGEELNGNFNWADIQHRIGTAINGIRDSVHGLFH